MQSMTCLPHSPRPVGPCHADAQGPLPGPTLLKGETCKLLQPEMGNKCFDCPADLQGMLVVKCRLTCLLELSHERSCKLEALDAVGLQVTSRGELQGVVSANK